MANMWIYGPPGQPLVYRPLSGLALAAFVLAMLFAGMVGVHLVAAFFQGSPFNPPTWSYAIPAAAVVLGFLGQSQINHSEGTRAGLKLARWAIGVSLVLAVVCGTYSVVTTWALERQADEFLLEEGPESGFFPHLVKAGKSRIELNTAFLLTRPPSQRAGITPTDKLEHWFKRFDEIDDKGNQGELSAFRSNSFIGLVLRADPDKVEFKPAGTVDWTYENRRYLVTRLYQMISPEGVAEFPVRVVSSEGGPGEQRKWHVEAPNTKAVTFIRSEQGQAIQSLAVLARNFVNNWHSDLLAGKPIADFKAIDLSDWNAAVGKDPALVAKIRERVTRSLEGKDKTSFALKVDSPDFAVYGREDGKLQYFVNVRVQFTPEGELPGLVLFGVVVVQTPGPFDPLTAQVSPEWEIRLNFYRVYPFFLRGKK